MLHAADVLALAARPVSAMNRAVDAAARAQDRGADEAIETAPRRPSLLAALAARLSGRRAQV